MPKRSNAFQKLVLALKKHHSDGATVEESKGLLNSKTGKKQEVDICITGRIGKDEVIVSVECKKGGRRASVEWVQRMLGKHADLPTNLLILAHSKGFAESARQLAQKSNAQTLTFQELSGEGVLSHLTDLMLKEISVTTSKVLFAVRLPDGSRVSVRVQPDTAVFNSRGKQIAWAIQVVQAALRTKETILKAFHAPDDATEFANIYSVTTGDEQGTFLHKSESNELHRMELIHVTGHLTTQTRSVATQRQRAGELEVVWGEVRVGGKNRLFVASSEAEGEPQMSFEDLPEE